MWPDERTPEDAAADRKEIAAQVDWFGEVLNEKSDIADDLVDPRYPLAGPMKPVDDWCKVVDSASWNHRDWALGLWHVVLGQILREQRIHIGREYFDGRFHLLILSPSGSGKTRAANQVRGLFSQIHRWEEDKSAPRRKGVPWPVWGQKSFEVRPIIEVTTAALIGGYEVVKGKKVPTEGLLQTADLLHWDEAEAIFRETQYSTNLLRALNMTMNPIGSPGNEIVKELSGVSNVISQTRCSLLMTAVDFLTIPEEVLRCGFYQRIAVLRTTLTPDQRRVNRKREQQIINTEPDTSMEFDGIRKYLEDLASFYRYRQRWDFRGVSGMMQGKYDRMLTAAGKNEQVRPYLEDFAERYMDKLYILSMHNCAMRNLARSGIAGSTTYQVTPEDVGRAWVVVKTCMTQFYTYIMEISHMWKYASEKAARRRFLQGQGLGR